MKKTEIMYLLVMKATIKNQTTTITDQSHWNINDETRPVFSKWFNDKVTEFCDTTGATALIVIHSNAIES